MPVNSTAEMVWGRLPIRAPESHKGSFGRLLLVAGSSRYRGAAALCAEGALRAGAGLVTLATVEPVIAGVLPRLPEAMFLPCRPDEVGGISRENLPLLLEQARKSDVLCLGPGLGNTPDTTALAAELLTDFKGAALLDADGLNALAGQALPRPKGGLVITPHPGEMARLMGLSVSDIEENREGIASGFARANRCVVVLKGHRTLIAGPEGDVYRNTTGNPGLARGGSGDVLSGIIAALLAQRLSPMDAALCGVWLHGAAADRCAARRGQMGMLPHDIFDQLGGLFAENGR